MPLSHEKQPLLLKVYEEKPPTRFTIKKFPPPELLPERQMEPIHPYFSPAMQHFSKNTTVHPNTKFANKGGEKNFFLRGGGGCQTGRRGNNYKQTCIWRI